MSRIDVLCACDPHFVLALAACGAAIGVVIGLACGMLIDWWRK